MARIVMADIVMAYVVMANIIVAYIVMAYTVMAWIAIRRCQQRQQAARRLCQKKMMIEKCCHRLAVFAHQITRRRRRAGLASRLQAGRYSVLSVLLAAYYRILSIVGSFLPHFKYCWQLITVF